MALVSMDVSAGQLIGVYLDRCPELIISLVAILRAGGAFVPLDPSYPADRISYMISDANLSIILSKTSIAERIPPTNAKLVHVDTLETNTTEDLPLKQPVANNDLAYVIYTSGTSGHPKGVLIERLSLNNYIEEAIATFELTTKDRVLQFASISFDTALEEIFPILSCGGTLVLRNDTMLHSADSFFAKCRDWGVTLLDLPTSYWHQIVAQVIRGDIDLSTIRGVIIGGERALTQHVVDWNQYIKTRGWNSQLWNTYGPTEATIVATRCNISHILESTDSPVPIGTPIRNAYVRILNESLAPVTIGEPGELFIGGTGLARSYLNCPELTEQVFIKDPYGDSPEQRLYRTGDIVVQRPDNQLEYVGRQDDQVKIAGFRVELAEIETTLASHPYIAQVAVRYNTDRGIDGHLLAYAVNANDQDITEQELSDYLRHRLPYYMLPQRIVILHKLPLTKSGKIDYHALPKPSLSVPNVDSDSLTTATPITQAIAAIWQEILDLPANLPGIQDSFFALGGNSLLAIKTIVEIEQRLGVQLTLLEFLDRPTLDKLSTWLEEDDIAARSRTIIATQPTNCAQPLSFQQEGLWVYERLQPNTSVHTVTQGFHLTGTLNKDALATSLNIVAKRHPALRTRYELINDSPTQLAESNKEIQLLINDFHASASETKSEHQERLTAALHQAANQPLNFFDGQLFRANLIQIDEQNHYLLLLIHHSVFDGWSLGILLHELSLIYTAIITDCQPELPALPISYTDFAVWQRNQVASGVWQKDLDYWRTKLLDNRTALLLPSDYPRTTQPGSQGATELSTLPASLVQSLRRIGERANTSTFVVFLAAFKVLLLRYTGETDIVVGTLTSGRERPELQSLIGYVANTLALRLDIKRDDSFDMHLHRVKEVWREALAHQEIPFDYVAQALAPLLGDGADLVDIFLVHYQVDDRKLELPGLNAQRHEVHPDRSHGDLIVWLDESRDEVQLIAEYDNTVFRPQTIRQLLTHFRTLLDDISSHIEKPITLLELLPLAEKHQRLAWNDTANRYPDTLNLSGLLSAQTLRTREATALIAADATFSYFELDQRANGLAVELIMRGIVKGDIIALNLSRSSNLVVSMLAVLKAGAAYLPLDSDLPKQRIALMLHDAGARMILTETALVQALPKDRPDTLMLDTDIDWQHTRTTQLPDIRRTPDDLAYIIYTSGSTGKPKGVMVTDRAVVNLLTSMARTPGIIAEDRMLAITPLIFDIALLELFLPLTVGAITVIATRETATDQEALIDACAQHAITLLQATPVTWRLLLSSGWHNKQLTAWCGGEAMPADLAELLCNCVGAVWNLYGPTETTVWSSCYNLTDPTDYAIIGKPIDNTRIAILSDELQLLPVGVTGEIFIGGTGLAVGYRNLPELNQQHFINVPLINDQAEPCFRTGDLARYRADGCIEYVGRRDSQIKLRGFRIELGEIEAALVQQSTVHEAAVAVYPTKGVDQRLIAYIVSAVAELDHKALKKKLGTTLPHYMIPQNIVELKSLPITANGKLDRQALPTPTFAAKIRLKQPQSAIGKYLALQWAEALGIPSSNIGLDDNFFDLGGHSLLAIQMVSQLRRELDLDLSLRLVYKSENLEQLVSKVEEIYRSDHKRTQQGSFVVPLRPKTSGSPLFCICGIDLYRHLANNLRHKGPILAVFVDSETDSLLADPDRAIKYFPSVEELSRQYVEAIVDYLPADRYHLAGVSFGGILAFEIAQQLRQRGLEVGMLALLDTIHPHKGFQLRPIGWILKALWESMSIVTNHIWATISRVIALLFKVDLQDSTTIKQKNDWGQNEVTRLRSAAYMHAQDEYKILPYSGKAVLIQASKTKGGRVYSLADDYGWSKDFSGEFEIKKVHGDHLGILRPPTVALLAAQLDQHMAASNIHDDEQTINDQLQQGAENMLTTKEKQQIIDSYELPDGELDSDDLAENAHSLVFYESKGAQYKRFQALCKIAKSAKQPFTNQSILDVGCGLGNLYDYLVSTQGDFEYHGVDITPSFILGAQKLHPGVAFTELDILTDPISTYDYVIASGIFTDAINDNEGHLRNMIKKMLEIARVGVSFNFLVAQSSLMYRLEMIRHRLSSDHHIILDTPEGIEEDDLYFYNKRELLKYFKQQPNVDKASLISGYIPGDATLHLIKYRN